MSKHNVREAVIPLLGSSIAIAYGGSALAFALIALWPLLAAHQLSTAFVAWILDVVFGTILLVTGFATLMRSNRARKVLLGALIATVLFELVRTTAFFPSISSLRPDDSHDILIVGMLLVGLILMMSPNSVRYTSSASSV